MPANGSETQGAADRRKYAGPSKRLQHWSGTLYWTDQEHLSANDCVNGGELSSDVE